jgi:hypothetical protein
MASMAGIGVVVNYFDMDKEKHKPFTGFAIGKPDEWLQEKKRECGLNSESFGFVL